MGTEGSRATCRDKTNGGEFYVTYSLYFSAILILLLPPKTFKLGTIFKEHLQHFVLNSLKQFID